MNDNMDVKTWKAYCELYEKIGKKIDQNIMQVFDNGIKCFSSYLCHANPEYVYSTTYLQQFNEEFWKFIEAFYEKYKIVDGLFSIGEEYPNVSIKIDKYWLLETDEKGESNRRTLSGPDLICDDKIKIECAVLYEHTVDYSIMRVIEIFYSFVKEPVRIDNLIVTHKYICDVWKNGSKHLYFYTLHNQEHAIVLIQNIVKLINTIDFLKISSIDYYILFLACYLHDISMVKIPACDSFLLDTDKADELAKTLLDSYNEEFNKANLTKNVQGNDIDILSVKKYMLDSYRKIDNYFEEAVRSKHANDSAAEIRKRSELNYLDTSMRELVAEVSEAHGADERDIYGIKSVASKQLISIKFDKILLRLADLLDMSSYRVSKPILYHNVEQMSEESAFHWISHLLTKGYSLRTEYEITDNAHVLAPKNIIEKLVLEIPVNISQMSALTCGRTCKKVGIDRNRLSQQGIVLVCGQECKDNGNQERNCNFLCKWFCVKNENLIKELAALKEYLNRNKNNYFKSAIEIRIKCNDRTSLDARQFEILNEYIGKM